MAENDFFVRFDSNAAAFALKIQEDLAAARTAVASFISDMQKEDQRLRTIAPNISNLNSGGFGGSGGGTGGAGGGGGQTQATPVIDTSDLNVLVRGIKDMVTSVAQLQSGFNKMTDDLGIAAKTSEVVSPVARAERERYNRSQGQLNSPYRKTNEPGTGRVMSPSPELVRERVAARLSATRAENAARRAEMSGGVTMQPQVAPVVIAPSQLQLAVAQPAITFRNQPNLLGGGGADVSALNPSIDRLVDSNTSLSVHIDQLIAALGDAKIEAGASDRRPEGAVAPDAPAQTGSTDDVATRTAAAERRLQAMQERLIRSNTELQEAIAASGDDSPAAQQLRNQIATLTGAMTDASAALAGVNEPDAAQEAAPRAAVAPQNAAEKAVAESARQAMSPLVDSAEEAAQALDLIDRGYKLQYAPGQKPDRSAAATMGGLSTQDRLLEQRNLRLASDPAALREQAKKRQVTNADLSSIVETFARQGYGSDLINRDTGKVKTDVKQAELLDTIEGLNRSFALGGERTDYDLRTTPQQRADFVGDRTRDQLGPLMDLVKKTPERKEISETLRENAVRGGRSTLAFDLEGGPSRGNADQTDRGYARGSKGAQKVTAAEQKLLALIADQEKAAATFAAQNLAQNPGYNPYGANFASEIEGSGQDTAAARQALNMLRRAVDSLDEFNKPLFAMIDALDLAEKEIDDLERKLLGLGAAEPSEQRDADMVATQRTLDDRLKAQVNLQRDADAMGVDRERLSPELRAGMEVRDRDRARVAEERRIRQEQQLGRGDNRAAAVGIFGPALGLKATKNDNKMQGLLGGLSVNPRNRLVYRDERTASEGGRDQSELNEANKIIGRIANVLDRREAALQDEDGGQSVVQETARELAEANDALVRELTNVLTRANETEASVPEEFRDREQFDRYGYPRFESADQQYKADLPTAVPSVPNTEFPGLLEFSRPQGITEVERQNKEVAQANSARARAIKERTKAEVRDGANLLPISQLEQELADARARTAQMAEEAAADLAAAEKELADALREQAAAQEQADNDRARVESLGHEIDNPPGISADERTERGRYLKNAQDKARQSRDALDAAMDRADAAAQLRDDRERQVESPTIAYPEGFTKKVPTGEYKTVGKGAEARQVPQFDTQLDVASAREYLKKFGLTTRRTTKALEGVGADIETERGGFNAALAEANDLADLMARLGQALESGDYEITQYDPNEKPLMRTQPNRVLLEGETDLTVDPFTPEQRLASATQRPPQALQSGNVEALESKRLDAAQAELAAYEELASRARDAKPDPDARPKTEAAKPAETDAGGDGVGAGELKQAVSGGFEACCVKIVSAINAINSLLKQQLPAIARRGTGVTAAGGRGSRVAGARRATGQADAQQDAADEKALEQRALKATARKNAKRTTAAFPVAARQEFLQANQLGDVVDQGKLALGTRLMEEYGFGIAKTTKFIRDQFNLTQGDARKFAEELTQTLNAKDLAKITGDKQTAEEAAEEERQKLTGRSLGGAAETAFNRETKGAASGTAQQELARLKQLVAERADENKVLAQSVRLYRQLKAEMGKKGAKEPEIRQRTAGLLRESGIKNVTGNTVDSIARASLGSLGREGGDAFTSSFEQYVQPLFGSNGFWSRVLGSTGTFIVRNFTAGFVFGATAAIQNIIAQAIETESTFIRVSASLEATGRSAGNLRTQLTQISTDYGVALVDVYTAAAGLTGVFETVDEIAGATRVVAQLELLSNGALNATEAMGALTSITAAFQTGEAGGVSLGVEGVQEVADVLTVIQENLGVNIEVSAEGVGRLAGLAQQINLSFEETATYVSAIAKLTNQTGAAAGEQFSRIIATMQSGPGRNALTESLNTLGPDVGIEGALAANNYSEALSILIDRFADLDEAQQSRVSLAIGGQRQAAAIAGLLNDGDKIQEVLDATGNSSGAAAERTAQLVNTIQGQVAILQQNLANFGEALVRSGILGSFLLILRAVNGVLGATNEFFSRMNDFADENVLAGQMRDLAAGFIAFAGAVTVAKVAINGLKSAAAIEGVGAMATGFLGRGEDADGKRRERRRLLTAGTVTGPTVTAAAAAAGARRESRYVGPARFVDSVAARTEAAGRSQSILLRDAGRQASLKAEQAALTATTRGQRLYVDALRTQSRALGASARAAGLMSRAATSFAEGGIKAQLALAGVAIAIAAITAEIARTTARDRDIAEEGRQRFGLTLPEDATDEERQRSAIEKRTDETTRPGYMATILANAFRPSNVMATVRGDNDQSAWGRVSQFTSPYAAVKNLYGVAAERQSGRLGRESEEDYNEVRSTATGYIDDVKNLDLTEEQVAQRQAALRAYLVSAADKAQQRFDSGEISEAELGTVLADYGAEEDRLTQAAQQRLRELAGLVGAPLNVEALTGVANMASLLQGNVGGGGPEVAGALDSMIQNLGLSTSSALQGKLYQLAAGGLAADEAGQLQLDIAREALAEANALADSKPLGSEGYEEAQDARRAALQTFLQAQSQIVDITLSSAQAMAEMLAAEGNDTAAIAQLDAATQKLLGYANEAGISPDERARRLGMARQSATAATAARNSADTRPIRQGNLGRRDAATRAQQALEIAAIERENTKANPLATPDEVIAAEERYYEALGGVADQGQSLRQAQFSRDAALRMDTLGRAYVEQASALDQVAFAAAEFGEDSQEYIDAQTRAIQAMQAVGMAEQALEQARYSRIAAGQMDSLARARTEEIAAFDALAFAREVYTVDSEEYEAALTRQIQSSQAVAAAAAAEARAARETQTARIAPGDAVSVAYSQAGNAQADLADLRARGFSDSDPEVQTAIQRVIETRRAAQDSVDAVNVAYGNLFEAQQSARGDLVGAAQAGFNTAQRELNNALRQSGGAESAAVIAARQTLIQKSQAIQDSIASLATAQADLAIAFANAADNSILAAQLGLQKGQDALARELAKSGGQRTEGVVNAEANVVSLERAARDAVLQDQLDSIDFNLSMENITSGTAIGMLQNILNTAQLTEKQRRDIMLKIKGLQDNVDSAFSGQFNLGDIDVPTVYEVRRAMKLPQYEAFLADNVASIQGAQTAASGQLVGGIARTTGFGTAASPLMPQTTTTNNYDSSQRTVVVNGVSFAEVVNYINQTFGARASGVLSTSVRRN